MTEQIAKLQEQVESSEAPRDLQENVLTRLDQLEGLKDSPTFLPELDRINRYITWIVSLPWAGRSKDRLNLDEARATLNKNHYGLSPLKERILEYMSVMKLNIESRENLSKAPILMFVGLVGTGKTTMASSIAEALGRPFARIPFGGMGDPLDIRGQSRVHSDAEPGKIIKALAQVKVKNPVILLDEIDRVTDAGRASIMGVLVELLDPEQNKAFVDHYLDYPFDLSEVLFVATANNTTGIATAVLDRLEPVRMPSYNDEEKITIARDFILPRALQDASMSPESIEIAPEVWSTLVRPLGFDAGIRTLERTVKGLVRKVAKLKVEGKGEKFSITRENVKEFIPETTTY